ncbi:MAG: protein-disulfide reductase DsbD domain-containing protein [Candidatus Zixiibacteriota bacterium]
MKKTLLSILLLFIIGCASVQVETPRPEHLEAKLISEVSSIEPGVPFWVGLLLEMEEGWHVNWKNPGDAGLAPTIKWELPEGFKADEIAWPIPARIKVPPFVLFGYEDKVVLPVRITPPNGLAGDKNIKIKADCDWVVCGDVCVPGSAILEMALPVNSSNPNIDPKWATEFAATREKLPDAYSVGGLSASATVNSIIIEYIPTVLEFPKFDSMVFFPEVQGIINNAADQKLTTSGSHYRLEIERDKLVGNLPETVNGIIAFKSVAFPLWTKGIYAVIPLSKSFGIRN